MNRSNVVFNVVLNLVLNVVLNVVRTSQWYDCSCVNICVNCVQILFFSSNNIKF